MDQRRGMWTRMLARLPVLKRIHSDERGGVSIETVLIIAAIALPILIYLIKVGWPSMKAFFNRGMQDLESGSNSAQTN